MAIHFWRVRKDGGISRAAVGQRRTDDDRDPRTPPQASRRGPRRRPRPPAGRAEDAPRPAATRRRRRRGREQDPRPPARAGQGRPRQGSRRRGAERPAVPARSPPPPPAAARTAVATAGPPVAAGPGGHTQRLLTVVKSGSIQDVKATPAGQGPRVAPPARRRVRGRAGLHRVPADLLGLRQRPAARRWPTSTRRRTPPRRRGTSSASRSCSTMFHPMVAGVTIPGMGLFGLILAPVHRPEPQQQARGPQVRHLAVHDLPDVLGGARHDRLVLPGPRLQLHLPVERRPLLRPVRRPLPP